MKTILETLSLVVVIFITSVAQSATTEVEIVVGKDGNLLVTYTDGSAETFLDGNPKDLDKKVNGKIRINIGTKTIKSYVRKFDGKDTEFIYTKLISTNDNNFSDTFDIPNFLSDTSIYVEFDIDLLLQEQSDILGQEFNVINGLVSELSYISIFDASSLTLSLEELNNLDQSIFDTLPTYTGNIQFSYNDSFMTVGEPSSFLLISFAIIPFLFSGSIRVSQRN